MTLKEFFHRNPRAAIAFSGGTDSAYLLYAAKKYGRQVKAYFLKTVFQPQFELDDAFRFASQLGCELTVLSPDILSCPLVAENGAERCYHCKKFMFSLLKEHAAAEGLPLVADGTNASDDEAGRPGMRAIRELGVRSPLRECGLTKGEVRRLSREAGLFTWDKPSYSCLATRVASGEPVTAEKLRKIEAAERLMFALGFQDFRIRASGGTAKIQVHEAQMKNVLEHKERLSEEIGAHFNQVVLDLRAREGSQ
jgi:uncharacterized protein